MTISRTDTIVAPATPQGVSALAVIRLSGAQALQIANTCFKGKDLLAQASHTVHYGQVHHAGAIIDEVLVALFRAPRSFTTEDSVEISCHGAPLVVKEVINALVAAGARLAQPGEFTQRAFLNGRLDLAQAEAVADLIHAENNNARQAALNQMRGGISKEIKRLRDELIHFASLIELELDFGEEDVEFAKRDELRLLIDRIQALLQQLITSFASGNVIKNGVPTVIAGKPNAGKSTLLNALLKEDKAIVSAIPGTTRDVIEDVIELGGISFRFIDTAGLRHTTDDVEAIGIARTRERMQKASLILYVFDLAHGSEAELSAAQAELEQMQVPYLLVGNKRDLASPDTLRWASERGLLMLQAATGNGVDELCNRIVARFSMQQVKQGDVLVTNLRHYHALQQTRQALGRVATGIDSRLTGDFIAMDIRQALHFLGEITGEVTADDLLANIFSKFCIGK